MLEVVDAIERLQKLRLAGAITESEFESEKSKLLSASSAVDEAFSEYHDASQSEYQPSASGKNIPLFVLALGLAGLASYLGVDFFIKQKAEMPFSLPASEVQAKPLQENTTELIQQPEPTVLYEFIIESYNITGGLSQGTYYNLKNRSTQQVMLASVKVNNRDDCIADVREKQAYDNTTRIVLSQFDSDGDIITGAPFDVGKTTEIKYDSKLCGEIVYADITLMDGTTVSLKSL